VVEYLRLGLELKNLYDDFRDGKTIKAIAKIIEDDIKKLDRDINIMEVCGGHTHTIMKVWTPSNPARADKFYTWAGLSCMYYAKK